jgi:hypothetical protein
LKLTVSPAAKVRLCTGLRLFQGVVEEVPLLLSDPATLST